MAARVQVIVETVLKGGNVLGALTSQFGGLGGMASQAGRAVVDAFKDALKVTQEYGAQVRDLSLISGTGAEATSRFIQVLDDYEISAADATAATRFLTKQGLTPTIETLAKLSDQYLALNTSQERNEFILKNLGRSGLKWSNVLKEGSAALREQGAAVNESLILTDQEVQKLEEVRLAQDEWNDAITGVKVELITGLLPAMTDMIELSDTAGIAAKAMAVQTAQGTVPAVTSATQSYIAWAKAMGEVIPVIGELALTEKELEEQTKLTTAANQGLLSLTMSLQSETDRYKGTQAELNEQMTELIKQHAAGTISGEEYKEGVQGITAAVDANKKAHIDAGNKIAFSLMQQKLAVDGLSDAEFDFLLKAGVQWGIMEQTTADAARTMDEQLDAITESFVDPISKMTQANEKLHALQNMSGQTWTYYVNIETSGRFPNLPNQNQNGPGTNAGVGYQSGQQTGGTVYAGRPYMVGEAGAEPFIPSQNGRILGHAESLHAMTVGGGGGNTNYFYGPVKLELSAGDAGGIMNIRM